MLFRSSLTVNRDFNPNAFINAVDHGNFNKLVDYVQHLDTPGGKQEYLDIIEQPAFKNDIPNEFTDWHSLIDWWDKFVMEPA